MRRVVISAIVASAFFMLANPVDWTTGTVMCSAFGSTSASDCEKRYKEQLKALQNSAAQAKKAAETRFKGEEGKLKSRLAGAEKAHKRAIRELHDPDKDQQARCKAIYEKIMATQRQIGEVTTSLRSTMDDAAWQSRMSRIGRLREQSTGQEAQLKSCRAKLNATHVSYGRRQEAMFGRFRAEAAISSLLSSHRSRRREALDSFDQSRARDVEQLNKQRDYCLKNGIWLGPTNDQLPARCACEIKASFARLASVLKASEELNRKIRAARLEYEIQAEEFIEHTKLAIDSKSIGLDTPLISSAINLTMAFGEYAIDKAGKFDEIANAKNATGAVETGSAAAKTRLGTAVKAIRKAAPKIAISGAKNSKEAPKAKRKIENHLRRISGGNSPLVQAFKSVTAQQEKIEALKAQLKELNRRETVIWDQMAALKCLETACRNIPKRSFALSPDKPGRQTFVKTGFGKQGPLHRILLATGRLCNPCEALKALYDLRAHRQEAHVKVDDLGDLIAGSQKVIAELNKALLEFLQRNKPSEEVARFFGNNGWNYLTGTIAASLARPAAGLGVELGETIFDTIDAIGLRGPLKDSTKKNVRLIEKSLHENQISEIYWRHYARSLDDEMAQAMQRLMGSCFGRDCGKIARATPQSDTGDTQKDMPIKETIDAIALLKGSPGQMNQAPGDKDIILPEPEKMQSGKSNPFSRDELDTRVETIFRDAHRRTASRGTPERLLSPPTEANFTTVKEIAHDPKALRAKAAENEVYIGRDLAGKTDAVSLALIAYLREISKEVLKLADEVERRSVTESAKLYVPKRNDMPAKPNIYVPKLKVVPALPKEPPLRLR